MVIQYAHKAPFLGFESIVGFVLNCHEDLASKSIRKQNEEGRNDFDNWLEGWIYWTDWMDRI